MIEAILTVNGGSSSIKFALYGTEDLQLLCKGKIDGIGHQPQFMADGLLAPAHAGEHPPHADGHEDLLAWLLAIIRGRLEEVTIVAAGHRVVHGGATATPRRPGAHEPRPPQERRHTGQAGEVPRGALDSRARRADS